MRRIGIRIVVYLDDFLILINFYLYPFCLIQKCLIKALRDHAELTLKTILWQAPTAPGAGMRAGPGSPERAVALGSRGPITPDVGIFPDVHLEIVQRQFERGSLSRQVVEGHAIPHQLLTTWNNWSDWCIPEHADPAISPSIAKVLDFFRH